MKNITILLLLLNSCYFNNLCESSIRDGQFEMITDYGTFKIERKGNWQIESSEEFQILYLNKIHYLDDCSYEVLRHKVLNSGILPAPDMKSRGLVEITKIEGNKFYFSSKIINTNVKLDGIMVKTSDNVSNEFNEIIANYGH